MFFRSGLVLLTLVGGYPIRFRNAAAQTTTPSAYPGCYVYCRYAHQDYDPERVSELCDKERSLGGLFLSNMKQCADCLDEEDELSSYFDTGDAQDLLDMVNLCQANAPTNHSEMVSAMSVISDVAELVGTIGTPAYTASSTSVTTTSAAETTTTDPVSTPTAMADEDSGSESRAWVAGPVVGAVVGVAGIILAAFLLWRRYNQRQSIQDPADEDKGADPLHTKPELAGESIMRHELEAQRPVETVAKAPPQELSSGEVFELPDNQKG
ncbi:hypothetical protein BJX99DRAFT_238210 [Aspergillus californicus]